MYIAEKNIAVFSPTWPNPTPTTTNPSKVVNEHQNLCKVTH